MMLVIATACNEPVGLVPTAPATKEMISMDALRRAPRHGALLRALLCIGMLATLAPASASADAYFGARGAQSSARPGGGVQTSAAPANYEFTCPLGYAPIANKPSGYAIGNCLTGVHQRSQMVSDLVDGTVYLGGFVGGNFSGCGWINVVYLALVRAQTSNLCDSSSIGYSTSEFMSYSDGCTVVCAGTPIANSGWCVEYANVRPWLSGQQALDPLPASRIVPPNATYLGAPQLAWRYVTKYPTTEGWGKWVMVRDRAHSTQGDGTWVFVPKICIAALA
jgi:hypothetical protein